MQSIMRISADHVVHTTEDGDVQIRTDSEGHNRQEQPEQENEPEKEELTEDEVKNEVVKLNTAASKLNYQFYFAFNPRNKKLCINVVDRKTRQIIRSFGQSEIEEMLKRLTVTQGVLVDYKR
jgi:uncharacterized FlaG/YvyC family protein